MNIAASLSTKNGRKSMTNNVEQNFAMVNFGRLQSPYCSWQILWTIDEPKQSKNLLINLKNVKDMLQKTLNAKNLKAVLWESISLVKEGKMTYADADSIATSAREILRATHTQLRIAQASNRNVPDDVIEFSENTHVLGKKNGQRKLTA